MFEKLFKNKTNTKAAKYAMVPCACESGNEHCDLILQLRKHQELRAEIKNQIEILNKDSRESFSYFLNFLRKLEGKGFKMNGFIDCTASCYNISVLEYTINDFSSADIWRITEELKTYRNKVDIISEKQRALKAVEDDIADIKSKLGIE